MVLYFDLTSLGNKKGKLVSSWWLLDCIVFCIFFSTDDITLEENKIVLEITWSIFLLIILSFLIGIDDVVAIMIPEPKGKEIVSLLERNITVMMHITVGTRNLQKYVSRTSVVFVSISFIVLMIISLAWLVFYYIQRFRYANARDRNQVSGTLLENKYQFPSFKKKYQHKQWCIYAFTFRFQKSENYWLGIFVKM